MSPWFIAPSPFDRNLPAETAVEFHPYRCYPLSNRVLMSLVAEMRPTLRRLARTPGFTTVSILTLALGIAGTTAAFSVINAVLLRPLPYHEPERLVQLWHTAP